ncbi:MAG: glycosyltransferase, partial [Deltaproteobacteria bacterium]
MKVVIAGGGTGGHLFPGIAIAEEFLNVSGQEVIFIGIDGELERKSLSDKGYQLRTIAVKGIRGKSLIKIVNALLMLPF